MSGVLMQQKIIVCFDKITIKKELLNLILKSNSSLKHLFNNYYEFEYDPIEFSHALSLFSKQRKSLEYHLSYYINAANLIFENIPNLGEYSKHITDRDRKRKSMEDIGVSLSSLFMVEAFGIQWQNISHVPFDSKLEKITPDFIAIKGTSRYFFEAKGTTSYQSISKFLKKAHEQVKSIKEASIAKLAFVSFIPSDNISPPPTMFVCDPVMLHLEGLNQDFVQKLHFLYVLKYSNFVKTYPVYRKLLKELVHQKYGVSGNIENNREQIDEIKKKIQKSFNDDLNRLSHFKLNDMDFIGEYTVLNFENGHIKIFQGIEQTIITKIVNFDQDIPFITNERGNKDVQTSIFSDGTIFVVEYSFKPKTNSRALPDKLDSPFFNQQLWIARSGLPQTHRANNSSSSTKFTVRRKVTVATK